MKIENSIGIKSSKEIDILRDAGKILAGIVEKIKCSLTSGVTTHDIDQLAERLIKEQDVIPAFKGYRGFPGCVCTSVNEEVVHGIPSDRELKKGDIVSIDIGIIYKNYYSDTAFTCGINGIQTQLQRLLDATEQSLRKGIEQVQVDGHLSDVSHAIQKYVESHGYSIVREFVGHGIGKNLHEIPEIPNFGLPHQGPLLKVGMVLAIEPMVNLGTWQTRILDDGWTVVTQDGKPSAHFEHTVAVRDSGPEILTLEDG